MTSTGTTNESDSDSALIDEAFERALAAFQGGAGFDLGSLAEEKPHLRARLEEAVTLARDVAVHAPQGCANVPDVAGYEIVREIGAGSMGAVYLARQRSLGGRPIALKVLPPSLGLSQRSRARFLSEARALGRLAHPGIVAVHDVIDEGGIVAYAMDWIPGGSLARVIDAWRAQPERDSMETLAHCLGVERGALAYPNAISWLLQAFIELLRALEVVHAQGLLHRDIKPANLLVSSQGKLLLSDFGLVHDDSSVLTRTGEFLGTVAYSSPEQLRGEREAIDARSDVYSVGITLFEGLALRRPYDARALAELERLATHGVFEPPRRFGSRLPRDLETILGKAIDPDPNRRYPSAEALAQDLEHLLAFRPILARPASRWRRLTKAARRNRGALIAASVGALAAVASSTAAGLYFWHAPREIAALRLQAELSLTQSQRYDGFSSPELLGPSKSRAEKYEGLNTGLEDTLELFDRALSWDPLRLFDETRKTRFERDVTALAQAAGKHTDHLLPLLSRMESALPITTRLARGFGKTGSFEGGWIRSLADATDRDRYAAGLLGFLLADRQLAIDAWGLRPIDSEPDALSAGALGEMYLTDERPDLAYPHLQNAFRLANQSNYLCCDLADCALRLGEIQRAEELLERAKQLPTKDPYELATRVRADLAVKLGDLDRARAMYADLFTRHSGPRLIENYADLLGRLGDYAGEASIRMVPVLCESRVVRAQARFITASEGWWWNLGGDRRREIARQLLDGDTSGLPPKGTQAELDFLQTLNGARSRFVSLPATRRWDEPPPRTWITPRFGSDGERVHPSLLEIADDVAFVSSIGVQVSALPEVSKDAIASLWFIPMPEALRATLVAAHARQAVRAREK